MKKLGRSLEDLFRKIRSIVQYINRLERSQKRINVYRYLLIIVFLTVLIYFKTNLRIKPVVLFSTKIDIIVILLVLFIIWLYIDYCPIQNKLIEKISEEYGI